MTNVVTMPKPKRIFCLFVGTIAAAMSIVIMSQIIRDLYMDPAGGYGRVGMSIQQPAMQIIHVLAAMVFWTALFLLGCSWIRKGTLGEDAADSKF